MTRNAKTIEIEKALRVWPTHKLDELFNFAGLNKSEIELINLLYRDKESLSMIAEILSVSMRKVSADKSALLDRFADQAWHFFA